MKLLRIITILSAIGVFAYGIYAIKTREISIKYVNFQGTDAVIGGIAHIILSFFIVYVLYQTRNKK